MKINSRYISFSSCDALVVDAGLTSLSTRLSLEYFCLAHVRLI